jgi:hypothetical protein
VELALSTLSLEPGPESAILRRAAVVLLLDLVKAFDDARERRVDLGFGFSFTMATDSQTHSATDTNAVGNVPEILRAVKFVESKETDTIVRGHIRVLTESMEAWVENYLLWGIRSHGQHENNEPRFELGDQLAGLDIQPLSTPRDNAGRPRIEEIE